MQILTKSWIYFLTNISPHSGAYKWLRRWELKFHKYISPYTGASKHLPGWELLSHKDITTQWCLLILTQWDINLLGNISPHSGAYKYLRNWQFSFSQIYRHTVLVSQNTSPHSGANKYLWSIGVVSITRPIAQDRSGAWCIQVMIFPYLSSLHSDVRQACLICFRKLGCCYHSGQHSGPGSRQDGYKEDETGRQGRQWGYWHIYQ